MKLRTRSGFSLVEVVIALAVIAIAFVPLIEVYSVPFASLRATGEQTTAKYLAMLHLEMAKNRGDKEAIYNSGAGGYVFPAIGIPPESLNDNRWRTQFLVSLPVGGVDDVVMIEAKVYLITPDMLDSDPLPPDPVVSIFTYIEDY
ncbi:MAG: type II secretion system protein [Candidatus Omnitrophica bacterium]|nr:type II secretion system protein [Candidatus Omnitrophota bacterium]MDD5488549.1 type II secretion system protein [Candidatus Omnitrophota bacterium]